MCTYVLRKRPAAKARKESLRNTFVSFISTLNESHSIYWEDVLNNVVRGSEVSYFGWDLFFVRYYFS